MRVCLSYLEIQLKNVILGLRCRQRTEGEWTADELFKDDDKAPEIELEDWQACAIVASHPCGGSFTAAC